MKTVKFTLNKVNYELPANQSGWVSDSEQPIAPEVIKILKNAPRVGYTSKGCPIIKSDTGTNIYLGCKSVRQDNEKIHACDGTSGPRTTASEIPLWLAQEIIDAKVLSKETQAKCQKVLDEQAAKVAAQKDKIKKMLAGLSIDQIAELLK